MKEIRAEANPRISLTLDGRVEITFTTDKNILLEVEKLKDKELNLIIKQYSKKRSLSQNSYFWVLIGEISSKMHIPKEEVYRKYIKDYGLFEIIPIKNEAVDKFKVNWESRGLGWITEELRESKLTGYKTLLVYYGTSSYNSNEMKPLLDAIVFDCEELGISTLTINEIMLLRNENNEGKKG